MLTRERAELDIREYAEYIAEKPVSQQVVYLSALRDLAVTMLAARGVQEQNMEKMSFRGVMMVTEGGTIQLYTDSGCFPLELRGEDRIAAIFLAGTKRSCSVVVTIEREDAR